MPNSPTAALEHDVKTMRPLSNQGSLANKLLSDDTGIVGQTLYLLGQKKINCREKAKNSTNTIFTAILSHGYLPLILQHTDQAN